MDPKFTELAAPLPYLCIRAHGAGPPLPLQLTFHGDVTAILIRWWCDVNRADANKQLMLPGNTNGTFLVRESRGWCKSLFNIRCKVSNIFAIKRW